MALSGPCLLHTLHITQWALSVTYITHYTVGLVCYTNYTLHSGPCLLHTLHITQWTVSVTYITHYNEDPVYYTLYKLHLINSSSEVSMHITVTHPPLSALVNHCSERTLSSVQ
jgi:hypothetical protein